MADAPIRDDGSPTGKGNRWAGDREQREAVSTLPAALRVVAAAQATQPEPRRAGRKTRMNRTSLIAVALALALASCSEQSPTSPSAVAGTDVLANAAWDATTVVPATDATPTVGQSRESGPRNAMPTEARTTT